MTTRACLTRLLNMYFTKMTERILENGGTIDKYMGDAVMADSEEFKTHKQNHDAFLAAYRAQDCNKARDILAHCRESDRQGLDQLYDVYAARVEEYSNNPAIDDWDGIYVAQNR